MRRVEIGVGTVWVALVASAAGLLLAGCAGPMATMAELRSPQHVAGAVEIACGSYMQLARYWNDSARANQGRAVGTLNVVLADGRAEITIGTGPYYGLIELKDLGRNTTRVTSYASGLAGAQILVWRNQLLQAHQAAPALVTCPAEADV
ncbi:hypothetical protein BH10PSE18_BH10PSE18_04080 [soil metagenome]